MTPYYLTSCTIVKNEALYLDDFINFHLSQGVEHLYFYDNVSIDETPQILENYAEKGVVTWRDWPMYPGHLLAYQDYIRTYRLQSKWCAFIDCDEFLYSPKGNLRDVLKDYEEFGGVAVHWYQYGSNGEKQYRPQSVLERFPKRAKDVNLHVKTILNMQFAQTVGRDTHSFYSNKSIIVNERKLPMEVDYAVTDKNPTAKILRINHYHTKSAEECREKCKYPRSCNPSYLDFKTHFPAHDKNEVEDTEARDLQRKAIYDKVMFDNKVIAKGA